MAAPSAAEGLESVGVLHMDTDLHLPQGTRQFQRQELR